MLYRNRLLCFHSGVWLWFVFGWCCVVCFAWLLFVLSSFVCFVSAWWIRGIADEVSIASFCKAVTGTAVMARSANEEKKKKNFWTRTSIEDAEALPEHLVRNYCGNSFHPNLISSALGNNTVLRNWVSRNGEGPSTLVAEQSEAFQVFSSLCDKVEAEAKRKRRKEKLTIDRTLPPFQVVSCVSFFCSMLLG